METKRVIGIQHRVKMTTEGEARPTKVAMKSDNGFVRYDLATATDELDFVLGRFPTAWREVEPDEDISAVLPHHVKYRREGKGKDAKLIPHKIPAARDGFQLGDVVAMSLGGSGDRMAFAISRQAGEISGLVLRIPPFVLKERRGEADKENDAELLANLAEFEPELFYPVGPRDRELIKLAEAFRAERDVMKERIKCVQRLYQRVEGNIFLSEDGKYPEGLIEDEFDEQKASDTIYQATLAEEAEAERKYKRFLKSFGVWKEVFEPIEGCGPRIATALIVAIGDIRRFKTAAKLKKFCGVHLDSDGEGGFRFARRRRGSVANWNPEARQALYLIGDQFNYHPDSFWGKKLREYKAKFREKHPEPVTVMRKAKDTVYINPDIPGKERVVAGKEFPVVLYSDGHIQKMALWRTRTKFVEHLFKVWHRYENELAALPENAKAA